MKIKKILGFVIFGVLGLSIVGATLGGLSYFDKKKTKEVDYQSQIDSLSSSLTELQTDNNTLKSNYSSLLEENNTLKNSISNVERDVLNLKETSKDYRVRFYFGNEFNYIDHLFRGCVADDFLNVERDIASLELMQSGGYITIEELMNRFNINKSTAYLYIKCFDTNLPLINNNYEIVKLESKYYLKDVVGL